MTSSAKQSILRRTEPWIASAQVLLAMTPRYTPEHTPPHSRGANFFARVMPENFRAPKKQRARGDAGCTVHPRSRVQCSGSCAHEHTGPPKSPGIPARNGLTAYGALSPATNSSCHRRRRIEGSLSPVGLTRLRRLDTSNGCQDHTVLPYASASSSARSSTAHGQSPPCDHVSRRMQPRPPQPVPRSMTIARAPPLVGRDGAVILRPRTAVKCNSEKKNKNS